MDFIINNSGLMYIIALDYHRINIYNFTLVEYSNLNIPINYYNYYYEFFEIKASQYSSNYISLSYRFNYTNKLDNYTDYVSYFETKYFDFSLASFTSYYKFNI